MVQLTLDLPYRSALGREDFLIDASNAEAVAAIDRAKDWPDGLLIVHGPRASGKTHLLEVWREMTDAKSLAASDLEKAAGDLAPAAALALDDAELAVQRREEALLHLVNAIRTAAARLLLTAKSPPARWGLQLPDLASRLNAAQSVALGAPSDVLLQALVVKLFSDRQLRIAPNVVSFVSSRMERSFAAVLALVEALDRQALASKREITIPLARQVLEALSERED